MPIAFKAVPVPHLGHDVVLVPRDQLRFTSHGRDFGVPKYLKGLGNAPTPPASFSWQKPGIVFPILGNDRYGDCYYAAACHASQCWTANAGQPEWQPDVNAVIARYLKVSGGDNGLGDQQMMPEWRAGIVGPNGPHRILDEMTVDPANDSAISVAMYYFCGLIYTASLLTTWLTEMRPGAVWDAGGAPDPMAGHAMWLTGIEPDGNFDDQTWGFTPPIRLTKAGMRASDPELLVAFSLDMFNAQGVSPAGQTYDDAAALWLQCGGQKLPPSPFGPAPTPAPPTPDPTPIPPAPGPTPIPPSPIVNWWAVLLQIVQWLVSLYGHNAIPFIEQLVAGMNLPPQIQKAIDAFVEALLGGPVKIEYR